MSIAPTGQPLSSSTHPLSLHCSKYRPASSSATSMTLSAPEPNPENEEEEEEEEEGHGGEPADQADHLNGEGDQEDGRDSGPEPDHPNEEEEEDEDGHGGGAADQPDHLNQEEEEEDGGEAEEEVPPPAAAGMAGMDGGRRSWPEMMCRESYTTYPN
ncbi:hypothetical protein ACLOJK_003975 [Asimina triloba]